MKKLLLKLASLVLEMPRITKRLLAFAVDLSLCVLTVWLAYYLRLGEFVALSGHAWWAVYASVAIALPIFVLSGFYRTIFRYSGWPAFLEVVRAVCIYGLIYASIFTAMGVSAVPRTVGLIQPILLLLFVGISRAFARLWLDGMYLSALKHASRPKVLIYGAGSSGRQLMAAMSESQEMQATGFLDDDERLHGQVLNGKPIYNPVDLVNLVEAFNISLVLLAMPTLNRENRNKILNKIRSARVAVRTLPSVADLVQGKFNISDLRELDIDDLLGRNLVLPNHDLMSINVRSKVVLVTGAGGSIGSELCRQILNLGPSKLLLIEQSEFALYGIFHELQGKLSGRGIVLVPLLATVQNYDRMREIMLTWSPETVYHVAAYKHVPLVEHNPAEGIKNNVLGTLHTAKAAVENGVSAFVMISTDKAVRPTNVMGASKRLAEMVIQALAAISTGTKFSIVRFGNVLGSSGSVVPKFRQQIRDGGPITLTHPEVTRYFMTIYEATQLVIQAGAMSKGGDVFILDMGEPIKIMDLARRLIELSGLSVKDKHNVEGDIEIKVTGLRPGEKLYEELLISDNPKPTSHPLILRAHEEFIPWSDLEDKLKALEIALNLTDVGVIRLMMQKLVTGYKPSNEIVDWVYLEQQTEA